MTPLEIALQRAGSESEFDASTLFVEAAFSDAGRPLPADLTPSHLPGEWTKYAWQHDQNVSVESSEPGDIAIVSERLWSLSGGLPIISDGSPFTGRVPGDRVAIVVALRVEDRHIDVVGSSGMERSLPLDRICTIWRPPVVEVPVAHPIPIVPVVHDPDGSPQFRVGNYDERVAVLSRFYRQLGLGVPVSSFYGETMAAATAELQRRHGRPDTGVVDGDTWALLGSIIGNGHAAPPALTDEAGSESKGDPLAPPPPAPVAVEPAPPAEPAPEPEPTVPTPARDALETPDGNPFLSFGVAHPSVNWLVDQLRNLGWSVSDAGGVYTADVANTVAAFQAAYGLERSGTTDDAFWDELAAQLLRRSTPAPTVEERLAALEARVTALESR